MSDEMLGALDEIYANANRLVGSVSDDQWEDKTPCSEWSVRDLVQHMSGTSGVCYAAATRTEMDPNAEPGDDPVAEFAAASAAASAAWRGEDALEGMVSVPADMPAIAALGVNIIDIGTHVWDLATALDQDHGLSPEVVAMIDQWNHNVVSDEVRSGGGFGEILEPTSDADLTTMLAFVGRKG